jgi:PPK2 family polyphosphate:nucleotide phosphotransferase
MTTDNYRVPFDSTFKIAEAATAPGKKIAPVKKLKKQLRKANDRLYELQRELYAYDKYSVLLVFQAMDAAGKDSTIRTVMRGVNPAGCQVFCFKQPSSEELEHDFLWRSAKRLPERGRIGIFNRSYYEETLVVRVHPEYLKGQKLPGELDTRRLWEQRFDSIRNHEQHLYNNGTRIIKFWLNVSKEEQKNRFLDRLRNPKKNWKFSRSDIDERGHWNEYMHAYEEMLNATSREIAPWYAIPADNKDYARVCVAKIIVEEIERLGCHYPQVEESERALFGDMEKRLMSESC